MSDETMDTIDRAEAILARITEERRRCERVARIMADALGRVTQIIRDAERQISKGRPAGVDGMK